MEDALKKDIENMVKNIFSEKEEASQMQKTQEALNESAEAIEKLTQNLEVAQTEMSEAKEAVKEELADKDSKISELTTELEAAQVKLGETEASLIVAEESLDNMKKDQLAEARMVKLQEAKVAMKDNLVAQTAKVREFSDEEFATYKADRIELRDAVKKELEAAALAAAETNTEGEEGTVSIEEEASTEEGTSTEEGVTTPPAEVAPGQAMAAAMNFENKPSDDMVGRYEAMGKAMAASLSPKKSDN
jgi:chromosome segregation ATPase